MNTNKQQQSDIELIKKHSMQFFLLQDDSVMIANDLNNPFPPHLIESDHPFPPLHQGEWIQLDTVGPEHPIPMIFRVHSVLHTVKRHGRFGEKPSRPEYGPYLEYWHTDVLVTKEPLVPTELTLLLEANHIPKTRS